MRIEVHHPNDVEQLRRRSLQERDATQRGRYRAVQLVPSDHTDHRNHHLRLISEHVGTEVHVVLVLDQGGWNLSKTLQAPANMTLLHLPPYGPELNPVERPCVYRTSHSLSNRACRDSSDLFNTCGHV